MRFLVIGASGFIGRHIMSHVRLRGFKAIGSKSCFNQVNNCFEFDLLKHRISDQVDSSFFSTNDPIFGVISVAFASLDAYATQPELVRKIHVDNTILLIRDFLQLGVRPVFLSTNYVFDGRRGYYDEHDLCAPTTEYGRSKMAVESFLAEECPDALVLRLQSVVGDDPGEMHLFSRWHHLVRNRLPIECIHGEIIAPTFVGDVARGIICACEMGLRSVYHFAGQEYYTRDELARQFVRALDADANVIAKPQSEFAFSEKRPLKCHLDSSRFRKATGMSFTSMKDLFNNFKNQLRLDRQV